MMASEIAGRLASLEGLDDDELERRLRRLASLERRALVLLLAHLADFDRRKLYANRGYPSLFAYCTSELRYSEQGAYKRIQAARAIRSYPRLLDELADAEINLATIVALAPHLRPDNAESLLRSARGLTIRQLESLTASLAPKEDEPDLLRALPMPPATTCQAAEPASASPARQAAEPQAAPRDLVAATAPSRHLFRFSGGTSLRRKFERAAGLLRVPLNGGAMERVFERALDELLSRIDPSCRGPRRRRNPGSSQSRAIPRALRGEIWLRDGGRCTFLDDLGRRCEATTWLEVDHIVPFGKGGPTEPSNLRLLCRAHNQLEARRAYQKPIGPT